MMTMAIGFLVTAVLLGSPMESNSECQANAAVVHPSPTDYLPSAADSLWRAMAEAAQLHGQDWLFIRFASYGECGKCLIGFDYVLRCVRDALGADRVRTLTAVDCDRQVEFAAFVRSASGLDTTAIWNPRRMIQRVADVPQDVAAILFDPAGRAAVALRHSELGEGGCGLIRRELRAEFQSR